MPDQITCEQVDQLIEKGDRYVYATPKQVFLGRHGAKFRKANPGLVGIWHVDIGGTWQAFRRATGLRTDADTFTIDDLSIITGVTPQNISYWLRDGVVVATAGKSPVLFSVVDAFAVLVVAVLRRHKHGLDLSKRIGRSIAALTPEHAEQLLNQDENEKVKVVTAGAPVATTSDED